MAKPQRYPTLIELDQEIAKRSLAEFCKMAWTVLEPVTPIKWGWALDAMCEHLEAVHSGEIKRLLMNVPPGMMKSLLTGVFFPAWEWGPCGAAQLRYLTTAHKEPLAVRDNMKCRRLIQSDWYQERWPVKLTGDQNAKTKFENVETGFRESMSFRSLTGSRGDRVIIDDPLSVDDAFSQPALDAAEQTFLEAVPSRVNNEKSAIIVIMQRLHERDTSGIILERDLGYTHLMLPMRFEEARRCVTSIGFKDPRTTEGELLFPERFSESQVKELEATMGSYAVAGQLQQRPVPAGGGLFKAEWLKFWTPDTLPDKFDSYVSSWDLTFKETATSDFVVGQIWGKKKGCFYLLDQVRGRMDFVKTRRAFIDMAEKWPNVIRKLVEDKANGPAIISALKETVSGITPVTPKESKEARASSITPLFEAGNVFLPPPDLYPWVKKELVPELLSFPAGAHDDQCFAAGTLIATSRGDVPIESVRPGDLVFTPVGLKRVLAAGCTGRAAVITRFGITATPNHPFVSRHGRIVPFAEIKRSELLLLRREGDKCRIKNLKSLLNGTDVSIASYREAGTTSVTKQQTKEERARRDCTLTFGNFSQERKSQKVTRCTTKTEILSTTISQTLSVCPAQSIAKQLISRPKTLNGIWTASDRLPQHGIAAPKDENGISSMAGMLPQKSNQLIASVKNAERCSKRSERTPSFVLTGVKWFGGITTIFRKFKGLARYVASCLQPKSERAEKVQKPVAEHIAARSIVPVYNLTIEDVHVFFANGVLVHNCDALSQALSDLHGKPGWRFHPSNLAALRRF